MSVENNNEVSVIVNETSTSIASILPSVFKDIDFETLNDTIDALGKNSNVLEKDEKIAATEILDSWKQNVIDRLRAHEKEMGGIVSFFTGNPSHYYGYSYNGRFSNQLTDVEIASLAGVTGTTFLYEKWLYLKEELNSLKALKPQAPEVYADMSALETMKIQNNYDFIDAQYNVEYSKLSRKEELAWKEFLKVLNTKDEVKEMIAKANKYIKNVGNLISDCDSKTNLAKLNVQINSFEVRASLKDLMVFTTKI